MVKLDMEAIRKLSVSERLALVEEIWESISDDPTSVPVSEAQLAEAHRRVAEHGADPTTAVPWDDAGAFLRFSVTYVAPDEAAEDALMAETESRLKNVRPVF